MSWTPKKEIIREYMKYSKHTKEAQKLLFSTRTHPLNEKTAGSRDGHVVQLVHRQGIPGRLGAKDLWMFLLKKYLDEKPRKRASSSCFYLPRYFATLLEGYKRVHMGRYALQTNSKRVAMSWFVQLNLEKFQQLFFHLGPREKRMTGIGM